MPTRLLAIIVLYGMGPDDSQSYRSLLHAVQQVPASELSVNILLYDNTPQAQAPAVLPQGVCYGASTQNRGLSDAYNRALNLALQHGDTWLMTLDQDTSLPGDALQQLVRILDTLESRPEVAAIAPSIRSAGRTVSPNTFVLGGWARWFPPGYSGIPERPVYAFNSGSILRVSALRQVGGYSPWFWLDNSDSWIFSQLALFGKRVYVAGGIVIDHDFSMMNMQKNVSATRYEHLLLAESAFWDLRMNRFAGWERTLRLLMRAVKHVVRKDSAALQRLTRQALMRRIFWSRRKRVAHWQGSVTEKLGERPALWQGSGPEPMLSVCLVEEETAALAALRPLLAAQDEIVVAGSGAAGYSSGSAEGRKAYPALVLHVSTKAGRGTALQQAMQGASGDILLLGYNGEPDLLRVVRDSFLLHPDQEFLQRNGGAVLAFRAALLPEMLALAGRLTVPQISRKLASHACRRHKGLGNLSERL